MFQKIESFVFPTSHPSTWSPKLTLRKIGCASRMKSEWPFKRDDPDLSQARPPCGLALLLVPLPSARRSRLDVTLGRATASLGRSAFSSIGCLSRAASAPLGLPLAPMMSQLSPH